MTTPNRNRLINAIVFFATETRYCGKIKLFKLLYLLDFEHFRQTGKSVTGSDYRAWKYGPVPSGLMEEWDSPVTPFDGAAEIIPEPVINYIRQTVVPRSVFDEDCFTERQLQIMENLVERFKDTYSPTMIDVTHAQNGAWAKVWQNGAGNFHEIPYVLAVEEDSPSRAAVLDRYHRDLDREAARNITHERT